MVVVVVGVVVVVPDGAGGWVVAGVVGLGAVVGLVDGVVVEAVVGGVVEPGATVVVVVSGSAGRAITGASGSSATRSSTAPTTCQVARVVMPVAASHARANQKRFMPPTILAARFLLHIKQTSRNPQPSRCPSIRHIGCG